MRPGRVETHQRRKKESQKRKNKPISVYNIKRGFNNMAVLKFNHNNNDKPEVVKTISEPIIPDEPKAKAQPKKTVKKSSKKKASSK